MATTIALTKGKSTVVDDEDAAWVLQHRWYLSGPNTSRGYAARRVVIDGHDTMVYLHRAILDAPDGLEVDHKDGDSLNNQRANLRLVTRSQNEQNKRGRPSSRTGVRGVTICKSTHRPYWAYVWVNGKRIGLGCHSSLADAAEAASDGRRRLMTHSPENSGG